MAEMLEITDLEVKRVTQDAILVDYEGKDFWLPKSQISGIDADEVEEGDPIDIEIPMWLAEEKGMV